MEPIQGGILHLPALFVDLDGTIRFSKSGDFINSLDDIQLFPDVEPLLWEYRHNGYLIIGISNQGGVAYGFKSPQQVLEEMERTTRLFKNNPFDYINYCLHHPNGTIEPFCHETLSRKPQIGMLVEAEMNIMQKRGIQIRWDHSLFVGDRPEDLECAKNAGIEFRWAWEFFGREKPKAG